MRILTITRSLVAGATLAAASVVVAAPQPRWTIVAIPSIAAQGGAIALGINNRGQVTGYGTVSDPLQGTSIHGFVWDNGTMTDIGVAPGAAVPFSQAFAINDRGTVVASDNRGGAYTWTDGVWTSLGIPTARVINKFDTLGGSYVAGRFLVHGYIYRDGVFTDIGTLGGEYSEVNGINDKGAVVGKSLLADNFQQHPYVYSDGVMKDLGTFGGRFGVALGINNRGEVVGSAWDAASRAHAFVHDGATMRQLFPGETAQTTAVAINDRGTIVGWTDSSGAGSWVLDSGRLTYLEQIPEVAAAGWHGMVVTGINDRGWMTGYGYRGQSFNNVSFVLIPK